MAEKGEQKGAGEYTWLGSGRMGIPGKDGSLNFKPGETKEIPKAYLDTAGAKQMVKDRLLLPKAEAEAELARRAVEATKPKPVRRPGQAERDLENRETGRAAITDVADVDIRTGGADPDDE